MRCVVGMVVLLVVSGVLAGLRPQAAPAAVAVPPAVLGWSPGFGRNVPLSAPLTVYFNQAMDRASVERAWGLSPAVPGSFAWSGTAVAFRPRSPLKPGSYYRLTIGQEARAVQGETLPHAFAAAFSTGDALRVTSFTPASETRSVPANGLIAISFDHPMVALSGRSAGTRDPQGWSVQSTPRTSGHGSWLGTSTWVFRPAGGLLPSTWYTVTLRGSARDAWGEPLGRNLRWSFRTVTPEVIGESPGNGSRFVSPNGRIRVAFNQPMNRAATARAFSLRVAGAGVAGTKRWNGNVLIFTPSRPLDSASEYVASVAGSATAANGRATLGKRIVWRFHAAPPPTIVSTVPDPGGTSYGGGGFGRGVYGSGVAINFSTPMSKSSLDHRLTITPAVSHLDTGIWGPDQDSEFEYAISGDFKPSTRYTVNVGSGVRDQFGRPLPGPFSFQFKMARLAPSIALYGMPGASGISFSAGRVVDAPIQFVNIPKVHYTLIRTSLAKLSQPGYVGVFSPPDGTTVRKWTETVQHPLDKVQNQTVRLAQKDGLPLAPGLYWLGAQTDWNIPGWRPGWNEPPYSAEIVVVTNVSVTLKRGDNGALVWVNSAQTGKPLSGVAVRLVNDQASKIASAKTDANGLHFFTNLPKQGSVNAVVDDHVHYGLAEDYWGPNIFVPTSGPNFWGGYGPSSNGTYVYTDRPVYRPGQQVHFRALLWRDRDGVYSGFGPKTAMVWASDGWGHQVYHARLTLDRFGSVHGSFRLRANAATGTGQISIYIPNLTGAYTQYTVAEYRKPAFLTSVRSRQSGYVQGDTLTARVQVKYVFGAPVIHQRASWVAYAQPLFAQPPGWDAYTFFDWEERWQELWQQSTTGSQQQSQFGQIIARGQGATDGRGNLTVRLPVDLAKQKHDQTITIEATTTDVSHQPVSGRVQVPAYKAALAIGLLPEEEVFPAGRSETVDIAAVKQDGTPIPNQTLTAKVFRRTYSSRLVDNHGTSTWETVPHDELVITQRLTTDAHGKSKVVFTPSEGGEYHVSVEGKDARGNVARTALSVYASAEGFSDWGPSSNNAIGLKPDKDTYQVGDTAHILVASPFADATALVTVERGTIRRYRVQHLATNSSVVNIPIKLTDLPNVYVTVTLYRGWRDNSPPDWRYGMADLHVRLDRRHLIVRLAQNGKRHHPGDPMVYRVTTTDMKGKPVSAQVSVALVDTAVLALQNELNPDILKALYSERPLGVSTASDGAISIDHLQAQPNFPLQPQGGRFNGPVPVPGAPAAATKPGGGGGCGAACSPAVTVRSRFADTAYWTGGLITDTSGRGVVRLKLPDNATTWRLDARGVTGDRQVGQAQLKTVATQDVILRPVLPRFLLQGDTLRIGTVVNNTLGRPIYVTVLVSASGIDVRRAARVRVFVPAHGERLVSWSASVPESTTATFTFRAAPTTGGVRGDAVRVSLPVHPPLTDETVATAGQVYGSVKQYVVVPRNAVVRPGALTVQISASLTAGMGKAYAEFRPQKDESNEDIADRVLAAGALRSLPATLTGLASSTYARLLLLIAASSQKLLDHQLGDGGWPWFNGPLSISDPAITADVLQALSAARPRIAGVNRAIAQGRAYLRSHLGEVSPDERAHLLLVLAESGRADHGATEALYNNSVRRHHLDVAALADLGGALRMAGDPAKARSVLSALDSRAVVSATGAHWEGSAWSFFSASVVATTTDVLGTLLALSPHDAFVPAAARWLMFAREGAGWDCPHDSAQAIAVLAAYARAAREGQAAYRYRVMVDGRANLTGRYTPANQRSTANARVPVSRLRRRALSSLVMSREAEQGVFGSGPMYYLARLRYFLPANGIARRDEGVGVGRQYLDSSGHTIHSAAAGSVVKVKLTIQTAQTLLYFALDDPIPAGLEPIDESLNTSQQGLVKPPQYFWYDRTPDLTWFLVHSDLRDDRVSLYATYLPPGRYTYTYLAEASTPGRYDVAPSHASETFFPEVFGRSAGQRFTVR